MNVTFCDAMHMYALGTTATPPTDGADPTLTAAMAMILTVAVAVLVEGKLFSIYTVPVLVVLVHVIVCAYKCTC